MRVEPTPSVYFIVAEPRRRFSGISTGLAVKLCASSYMWHNLHIRSWYQPRKLTRDRHANAGWLSESEVERGIHSSPEDPVTPKIQELGLDIASVTIEGRPDGRSL